MIIRILVLLALLLTIHLPPVGAHDLWVETNVAVLPPDEAIEVAFKLGNCDRGQRTFRTSGLLDKAGVSTFEVKPKGKRLLIHQDLARSSDDDGGYWQMTREMKDPGLTWFCQLLDQAIEHDGKRMRGLVSGKAFVFTTQNRGDLKNLKADATIGFPMELVLLTSPFPSIDHTKSIRVRLLLNGKPLRGEIVSFLPHSIEPKKKAVVDFERETDEQGVAEFDAEKPGLYLISAHHAGGGHDNVDPVYYSTTLTLRVTRHELSW